MAVNFSDLPSTTTPINATNLNKIQSDLLSEVFTGNTRLTDIEDAETPGVYQFVGTTANVPAKIPSYGNIITIDAGPSTSGERYKIQLAISTQQNIYYPYTCAKRSKATSTSTWTNWDYFGEYDSGWVSPGLGSNFELYSSAYQLRVRKIGDVVYIQGAVKPKINIATNATTADKTIITLTSQYRPAENMVFICKGSDKNTYNLAINPSTGQVYVGQYGTSSATAIPAGALLMVYISYVVG